MLTILKFLFDAVGIGLITYSILAWITMGNRRMENPLIGYTEKDEMIIKGYLTAGCIITALGIVL